MITAVVLFDFKGRTRAEAEKLFRESAPRYRGAPGLVRKYYLYDGEAGRAGGAYLWKTRADAEAMYSADWRRSLRERYGSDPQVSLFETPVIVDNQSGAIESY